MLAAAVSACGGRSVPEPAPGASVGFPPDLRGRRVVLLPMQRNQGVRGDVDAEIRFAFSDLGREVEWVFEDEVREALDRAPTIDADTRGLPVEAFNQAIVERVGDPLYGQLRRISALVDGEVILIPIRATFEPNETIVNSLPRVRLSATLIEPRTGRVLWFGIEEGQDLPQSDPRALASAVETLARSIFWYAGAQGEDEAR